MNECRLCRWPAQVDDVAVGDLTGRYICLRCFHLISETTKPLPKALRRQVEQTLEALGVGSD